MRPKKLMAAVPTQYFSNGAMTLPSADDGRKVNCRLPFCLCGTGLQRPSTEAAFNSVIWIVLGRCSYRRPLRQTIADPLAALCKEAQPALHEPQPRHSVSVISGSVGLPLSLSGVPAIFVLSVVHCRSFEFERELDEHHRAVVVADFDCHAVTERSGWLHCTDLMSGSSIPSSSGERWSHF